MRCSLFLTVAAFATLGLGPRSLAAQSPAAAPTSLAFAPHPTSLLAISSLPAPVDQEREPANNLALRNEGPRTSTAVALMIVGVAGIITGAATDEDIVTVAGAAAAGIGLYLWLR